MIKQSFPSVEPLAGELIVRNGPDRGVSRSLLVPITLVGRGESCDLRILDETVRLVHCAVSVTPEGPHLQSVGGVTPVNGVPSSSRLLQSGDIVLVGPVELEVHWHLPPSPTPGSGAADVRPKLNEISADEPHLLDEPPARRSAHHRVAC
ncbi:MAG TPA: FHA domain-containing protein [Gemmataceae bacterium]|jgi:predicted component of type VI protein secretion system|nr:FHA domain-containing protein [Gemmataceae bacterium]